MNSKKLLIYVTSVILTVLGITILRAAPPLNGLFELLEAKWGQSVIVGLQAGISAGVAVLVSHLYWQKRSKN